MTLTQTMVLNSEKKHSFRYDALPGEKPPLSSVYISKRHITTKVPREITVTIEMGEEG